MTNVQSLITWNRAYQHAADLLFEEHRFSTFQNAINRAIDVARDYEMIAAGIAGLAAKGRDIDDPHGVIKYEYLLPFAPQNGFAAVDITPGPTIAGTVVVHGFESQKTEFELYAVNVNRPVAIIAGQLALKDLNTDLSNRRLLAAIDTRQPVQTCQVLIGKERMSYDLDEAFTNEQRDQTIEQPTN